MGSPSETPPWLLTFWSKPDSLFGLFMIYDVNGRSHTLTMSLGTLALTRLEAARRASTSRFRPLPKLGIQYIVRKAPHPMKATWRHAPVGYPWRNTGSGQQVEVTTRQSINATSCRRPSSSGLLPAPSSLRTVRAAFTAHGSSPPKATLLGARLPCLSWQPLRY